MPDYKTHSIHAEKVLPFLDKRIDIDKEDLKVFSFGPDCLAVSDMAAFNIQHDKNSKYFFECLLRTVKLCKYQDNKEIIAFLYGQLEHFILDSTFHPYIYYVTPSMPRYYIANSHMTFELWLDDYFLNKYKSNEKDNYSKHNITHKLTRDFINYVYKKIYGCKHASEKYDLGINAFLTLENARKDNNQLIPNISRILGISDISYYDSKRIHPYLNTDRDVWYNPFNLEEHHESLNELWNKSVELYLQIVEDVNRFLYDDKELKNSIINGNLSYDTGLDCKLNKRLLVSKIRKQ